MHNATAAPAFIETVARESFSTLVYRAAGVCGWDAAPDVVQEAFLDIWRKREEIQEPRSAMAFTTEFVKRRAMFRCKEAGKRPSMSMETAAPIVFATRTTDPASRYDGPDTELAEIERRAERSWKLAEALAMLSERQRRAVLMHFAEGMSWADIAEELGTTERRISSAGHTGMCKLRAYLGSSLN